MERNDTPIDTKGVCAVRSVFVARSGARKHISPSSVAACSGVHIVFQRIRIQSWFAILLMPKGQCRAVSFLWRLVSEIESHVFIGAP